jgi:hypothetical protein
MGFQVFPAASGAADYENVSVHVEANAEPIADAVLFNPVRSRFTVTSALTAGIYKAETDSLNTVTAQVVINNSTFRALNPSMGSTSTSGVTFITVSTNQSSFQANAFMGWNQTTSGPFAGNTAKISFTYAPVEGDTRPFVVAGGRETAAVNQITWSTDGISWTEARPDSVGNASQSGTGAMAWSDGTNLYWSGTINSQFLWWSTNEGVNWTTRGSMGNGSQVFGYYDTVFARHYVWGNEAIGTPYTSTNGINWSSNNRALGNTHPGAIQRIGDRLYITAGSAEGSIGSTAVIAFTTNGTNWNNVTTFPTSTGGVYALCYSTAVGRYVAAGSRGGMFHSTDGLNWTTGNKNTNLGVSAFQPGWYSVNYGDGYFVAAGSHNAIGSGVIISTDGINWTDIGTTSGVLIEGSTSQFIYQGTYNPAKSKKWLFYQFVLNGQAAGAFSSPATREPLLKPPSPTTVYYHDNVVGRIKQGFRIVLSRFKMGRDIR